MEKITQEQLAVLSPEMLKKYEHALYLCESEDAGGPGGGWADGHKILKEEFGYIEKRRKEGHRIFVSLTPPTK